MKLIEFLESEGLLYAYANNYINYLLLAEHNYKGNNNNFNKFHNIHKAFIWAETHEKYAFWTHINNKFNARID